MNRSHRTNILARGLYAVFGIIGPIALLNFIAFLVAAAWLNGVAFNGYARDGHYFFCHHGEGHGPCHEVSQSVFNFSWWLTVSNIGTMGITVILYMLTKKES